MKTKSSPSLEKVVKKSRKGTDSEAESNEEGNEKTTVSSANLASDALKTCSEDMDLSIPKEKIHAEELSKTAQGNSGTDCLKNPISSSPAPGDMVIKKLEKILSSTEELLTITGEKNIWDRLEEAKSKQVTKKRKMNTKRKDSTRFSPPEDKNTRTKRTTLDVDSKTSDGLVSEKEVTLPINEKRTRRKRVLSSNSINNEASSSNEIETPSPPIERSKGRRKRILSSSSLKTDDSSLSEMETSLPSRNKLTRKNISSSCSSKLEKDSLSEGENTGEKKRSSRASPSDQGNRSRRRGSKIKETEPETKADVPEVEKLSEVEPGEILPSSKVTSKSQKRASRVRGADSKTKYNEVQPEVVNISEEEEQSVEISPSSKPKRTCRSDTKYIEIDYKTRSNKPEVVNIGEEDSMEMLPTKKVKRTCRSDSKVIEIDSKTKSNVPEVVNVSEDEASVQISPSNKPKRTRRSDPKTKTNVPEVANVSKEKESVEISPKSKRTSRTDLKTDSKTKSEFPIEKNKSSVEFTKMFSFLSLNSCTVPLPTVASKFQADGIHLELPKVKGPSRTISILLSDLVVDKLVAYCDEYSSAFVSVTASPAYAQYLRDKLEIESEASQYYVDCPEKEASDELKLLFLMQGVGEGLTPFLCGKYSAKKLCLIPPETGRRMLAPTSQSESLVKAPPYTHIQSILVTKDDLDRLGCRKKLNDTVIDTYLNYLYHEEIPEEYRERTHIFGAFFWINVLNKACQHKKQLDMKSVKCVRDVDLFSKDFIFIPINRKEHWYLAVICFLSQVNRKTVDIVSSSTFETRRSKEKENSPKTRRKDYFYLDKGMPCICFFDSMDRRQNLNGDKMGIAKTLKEFLKMLWKSRHPTETNNLDNLLFLKALCPQQENGYDCGIYMLQYVESFFKNPIPYFANPMPDLRSWFCKTDVIHKRTKIKNVLIRVMEGQPKTTEDFEPGCSSSSDVIALS